MHLTLSSPGIWMQMHQVIPGKLDVSGVIIPGEPFIVAGHNEKIAWGFTNMRVDNIDLFAEKINPENEEQYYYNGLWNNMKSRDEIIRIKGGKQDTFRIKLTNHGPLIYGLESINNISLPVKYSENQEKWNWGRIHKITIRHPICSNGILSILYGFNSKKYHVGGSDHTIKPFYSEQPGFEVNIGASERHIFNTADWDESYTIIPTGVSGIPGSEFYLSQTENYIKGDFYKDPYSENAVRAATKYTLFLRSKK
jgi:acyl-homoserine lactone acylase PvdQ